MEIVRAETGHIADVGRLFDLYRQFYECDADISLATDYIAQRINNNESTIFVAIDDKRAVGFVQLYPSFCSVEAIKIQILYDLYVENDYRKRGVAEALMNRATEFARDSGAQRIDLLTAFSNLPGQQLYEKLGYAKVNEAFHAYSLVVS